MRPGHSKVGHEKHLNFSNQDLSNMINDCELIFGLISVSIFSIKVCLGLMFKALDSEVSRFTRMFRGV